MEDLKLTPLTKDDSKEYLRMVSEVFRKGTPMRAFTPGLGIRTEEEFLELLKRYSKTNNDLLAIRNGDNNLVGAISLDTVPIPDTKEVSIFIGEEYRGRKYATKALAILIQNLKDTNIKKLIFEVSKNNKASLDILKFKLGAKYDHDFDDDKEFHYLDL